MQRRNILVLGIAVLFGLAAVWLANTYFGAVAGQAGGGNGVGQQTVRILAAKQDIAFGEAITPESAQLVDWPASSVPQGAVTAQESQAFLAKANSAVRALVTGEPILQSRTSNRAMLSATLPADQRAVSIPIDFVSGVSGFVKPGDIVDVVLTRAVPGSNATADEQMATLLLQNVSVLAIDTSATDKPAEVDESRSRRGKVPEFTAATLMVDPLGAQKLALAAEVGKLTLVLRNANDRTPSVLATVLPRDLGSGMIRPASATAALAAAPAAGARPVAARRAPAQRRSAPEPVAARQIYRPTMAVLRGTQESVESVMSNGY